MRENIWARRPDIARDLETHEVIVDGHKLQASEEGAVYIFDLLNEMKLELARFHAWRAHVDRLTDDIWRSAP